MRDCSRGGRRTSSISPQVARSSRPTGASFQEPASSCSSAPTGDFASPGESSDATSRHWIANVCGIAGDSRSKSSFPSGKLRPQTAGRGCRSGGPRAAAPPMGTNYPLAGTQLDIEGRRHMSNVTEIFGKSLSTGCRSDLHPMARTLLPPHLMRRDGAAPLIGSSDTMRSVRDRIERVAATDFTILIDGESGVGQRARRPAGSRAQRAPSRTVRRRQLRRARRIAARGRALWHRRQDGNRRARTARQVRVRRRRHAVPRRSGRSVVAGSGKAPARAAGSVGRTSRRQRPAPDQHARRGSHQQETGCRGRDSHIPRGFVLPPHGHRNPRSASCASGAKTSSSSHRTFSNGTGIRGASLSRVLPPTLSSPTTGRGTCASSSG